MVTFAELKNTQAEGLKRAIAIVEKDIEKIKTDQRAHVERALAETKEALTKLEHLGTASPTPTTVTEDEEEEIAFTKKEVEKILTIVKRQKDLLLALKEYVGLGGKINNNIVEKVKQIQKTKSWAEVKRKIEEIRVLLRKEQVILINREERKISLFIAEERKVRDEYQRVVGFLEAIFHKVKTPTPTDPHYALYMELDPLFQKVHDNLDEQAKMTRMLADIFRVLVGPTGMTKKLLDELETQKQDVTRNYEEKGIEYKEDHGVTIMKMIAGFIKSIEDLMGKQVVTINKLGEKVNQMIEDMERVEKFLETEAKKLAT